MCVDTLAVSLVMLSSEHYQAFYNRVAMLITRANPTHVLKTITIKNILNDLQNVNLLTTISYHVVNMASSTLLLIEKRYIVNILNAIGHN